jgi:hypothetical protein
MQFLGSKGDFAIAPSGAGGNDSRALLETARIRKKSIGASDARFDSELELGPADLTFL